MAKRQMIKDSKIGKGGASARAGSRSAASKSPMRQTQQDQPTATGGHFGGVEAINNEPKASNRLSKYLTETDNDNIVRSDVIPNKSPSRIPSPKSRLPGVSPKNANGG